MRHEFMEKNKLLGKIQVVYGACARKAMESGEYTIAGPFELIQGGTGALLLDPIYTTDASGCKQFWGFSLLVIDWEKFVDELQLNKLEEASYHFRIWKKGRCHR